MVSHIFLAVLTVIYKFERGNRLVDKKSLIVKKWKANPYRRELGFLVPPPYGGNAPAPPGLPQNSDADSREGVPRAFPRDGRRCPHLHCGPQASHRCVLQVVARYRGISEEVYLIIILSYFCVFCEMSTWSKHQFNHMPPIFSPPTSPLRKQPDRKLPLFLISEA